jgi:hydrogenase maturation protease
VRVHDYGIAGIHLAYDLLDGFELLVLIDTLGRGEQPGTVSVLEVSEDNLLPGTLDAHGMDPATVLSALHRLGGTLPRTLVVGCEPADTGEGLGLSPIVERAVEPTLTIVLDLVERELATINPER